MNLWSLVYQSASDSFILVGTFVAVTLILFGFLDYKSSGKLLKAIEEKKKIQVFVGTFLGLTPGCGGAIMVVPLYLTGKVSFGTLLATFIATMGDAAFILVVTQPKTFIYVLLISGFVAVITGLTVDYFGIGKGFLKKNIMIDNKNSEYEIEFELVEENKDISYKHIGHIQGDFIDKKLHSSHKNHFLHRFSHGIGYKIFWIFIILGFPLGIMDLMQIDLDKGLFIKNLSWIGFLGTLFSIFFSFINKKFISDDSHEEMESKRLSLKEMIIHSAEETAFVITWVFIAFLLYNIGIDLLGGEKILSSLILKSGFMVVITAIIIGLIPGCGPQILLTTLFLTGTIPFSALIANAICNDGDALFPLLALNKKASIMVTLYNLIPAFLVGGLFYLLEINNILIIR